MMFKEKNNVPQTRVSLLSRASNLVAGKNNNTHDTGRVSIAK